MVYGEVHLSVEIINTGTELMLGYVLNRHAAWLGLQLEELGLRVDRQITVPDGMAIWDVMKESAARASIVIVTGGLGPTSDDMTREIAAKLFNRELVEDREALRVVTAYFKSNNRGMPSINLKQAMIPAGAVVLDNPNGTAPGLYLPPSSDNPSLFLLPGPPHELHPMYEEEVKPRLMEICREAGLTIPAHSIFKTVGIGESLVNEKVDMLLTSVPFLEVGYCAHPGEVDIRLIGPELSVREGEKIIHSELEEYLVNDKGKSLAESLIRLLQNKKWKMSTAESCTGGLIASCITDIAGASSVFDFGWVTYSNEAKTRELGVPRDLLDKYGAVSEEVARTMAGGSLSGSGADISVAVTGVAGPDGGYEEKPIGTVWIAWAQKGGKTFALKEYFPGGREQFKNRVLQTALFGLFRLTSGLEPLR